MYEAQTSCSLTYDHMKSPFIWSGGLNFTHAGKKLVPGHLCLQSSSIVLQRPVFVLPTYKG